MKRISLRDGSLRLRFGLLFGLFLLVVWGVMLLISFFVHRKNLDTFFDTQQLLYARTLLQMHSAVRPALSPSADGLLPPSGPTASEAPADDAPAVLPSPREVLPFGGKKARGRQNRKALFFAVYDGKGNCLLRDGGPGKRLTATPPRRGFVNRPAGRKGALRREVWLSSPDGERIVVVGQDLAYRRDMALSLLWRQMLPWLPFLPVCLLGLFWLLGRETAPFRELTRRLARRSPQDATPLTLSRTPAELRPLVEAQNALFARMAAQIERERAFVADAAHELRTPLAGLRIQAEVIALLDDDAPARHEAVAAMLQAIDRCGRLAEQLLALSRLEALCDGSPDSGGLPRESVDWPALLDEALAGHRDRLHGKNLAVSRSTQSAPSGLTGFPPLLRLLLRNALDNAVRYTPQGGSIRIVLTSAALTIANNCPALPPEQFARVGERFFRPPGQEERGSGLGCSIMRRIARLHGFSLHFGPDPEATARNGSPQGFAVRIIFAPEQDAPEQSEVDGGI